MELTVKEEKKGKMVFLLDGATHTSCNLLNKALWKEKSIKHAGYTIPHPLVGKPEFTIETDGESPKKVVVSASQKVQKDLEKFSTSFKKEVK